MTGRQRLEQELGNALGKKQDKPNLVPALLGAYINGQKTIKVASRNDFVWCRLRGSTSERVQAFNDVIGLHYDLPILIYRDPNQPNIWKVYGRDITQYQDWADVSYLPPHGATHSFIGGIGSGNDPVWVYKRQIMEMLPRPVISGTMGIYIDQGLFYWGGAFNWWGGTGTGDLSAHKPTGTNTGKFLTVYIRGSDNNLMILDGDEFDLVFTPEDATKFIPVPAASEGIPIASVLIQTGTTRIGWHEIYDLRLSPSMLPQTGSSVGIYDEGLFQGGVASIDFQGSAIEAVVSGSYAYVTVTAADPATPVTGSVVVYDEGALLGSFPEIRFIGSGVVVENSGTYAAVDVGGGGGGTGSVVLYDDGVLLGSVTEVHVSGDGVTAAISGTYGFLDFPGGVGDATYLRSGEAEYLVGPTGTSWRVPDQTFETGTLAIAINGIWQTPVTDFQEQYAGSGTFVLSESPPTGSFVSAIWGVSAGNSGGTIVVYDEGTLLGSFPEMRFIGSGVSVENSGSYAAVSIDGGGGGGGSGSVVILDEGGLLGSALEFDFVGAGVDATISGSRAQISIPGGGGGSTVYPRHVTLWPGAYTSIGQGSWSINTNSSSVFSSYYSFGTSPSNGDNVSYTVDLDAGTYGFNLVHHKNTSAGIMKIDIDGVEVGSIDLYAGLTWNVTTEITGISIPTAGQHTIRFRMDGKNASSTGYNGYCVVAGIYRTA